MSLVRPIGRDPTPQQLFRGRLTYAAVAAAGLSSIVVLTAANSETNLGAPHFWPWLLTGLQVVALWSAGTGRWWGWLLGGSVQLPWVAYAIVTTQFGFIPGCLASSAVQLLSFSRADEKLRVTEQRRCRGCSNLRWKRDVR